MKLLNQMVIGAVLAMGAASANAQTVTFNMNYLAGITTGTASQTVNSAASGYTTSFGSITLTDLADLNLNDGYTGVRVTVNTDFSSIASGTGTVYLGSYELNFPGTSTAVGGTSELSSALTTTPPTWRYVSGLNVNTARSGGPIEFAEDGNVNGWGQAYAGDPSFEQEINYVANAFTSGQTSTIDFLNGNSYYAGFSVASLLANPVGNTTVDALNPNARPDAFAWFKIKGTAGSIVATTPGLIKTNSSGALSLNVVAVPEPETYGMMLAGLGLMGFMVRRRRQA